MRRVTTIAAVRDVVRAAQRQGQRVGLVPTMGALHQGHLSLVEQIRDHADLVITSIFVNPTQFGPGEDLDAYPRDVAADEGKLAGLGDRAPDLVFAPEVAEVYPHPAAATTVHVASLGDRLCGASRPTHFDGVTTVVSKLFNIVGPDVAIFGRKDFQQLTIIRRMVRDLDIPVEILSGRIVREVDGVAMSSRNRYLTGDDRLAARTLSRALRAAVLAAREAPGMGMAEKSHFLDAAARRILAAESRTKLDYLELLHPETLESLDPAPSPGGEAEEQGDPTRLLVAIAAHVGPARLIDNVVIGDADDEDALLAATATN